MCEAGWTRRDVGVCGFFVCVCLGAGTGGNGGANNDDGLYFKVGSENIHAYMAFASVTRLCISCTIECDGNT